MLLIFIIVSAVKHTHVLRNLTYLFMIPSMEGFRNEKSPILVVNIMTIGLYFHSK